MLLLDLNPHLKEDVLVFSCPNCKGDYSHSIRITKCPKKDRNDRCWIFSGVYPDTLTLQPSINAGCWHGYITDGKIVGGLT